jgi:serine/threonine protein kinase
MSAARFSASFPAPASAATGVPATLAPGEALGVWRIAAALHACDSGRWYRAEHALAPGELAAVLVYRRPADAAVVLLRFAELAGALSQLRHPAIATPLDSGLTPEGQPYLVLQWQEGQPLLTACAEQPLRQRLQLLLPLCEALHEAHDQGLLLRELDPGLLWLGEHGRLRLMGLGLAELAPEPDAPAPQFSSVTQPFVAPELQAGGQPSLASEAYALGLLACWLINGRAPKTDARGLAMPSAASLAALNAADRLSLEALLQKALAAGPAQRHPSVRELGEDLRAWLGGQHHSALALNPMPVPAPEPVPPDTFFTPAFDGSASLSTPPPKQQPPRKRWRKLLAAGGLALLAVGGWAGHEVYQRHGGPQAAQEPVAPSVKG